MSRILVTRMDSAGDVILAGPAVAAAAAAAEVSLLCGPAGEPAACLLPGVAEVLVWDAPWTGFSPPPVDSRSTTELVDILTARRFEAAAILTSFHQSPLPMALLLRLAGIDQVAAVSVDYPGSLLDHRVEYREGLHEVEQALEVTAALGLGRPDDDRLSLTVPTDPAVTLDPGFVIVHPAASVAARSLPARLVEGTVRRLSELGRKVAVTGTAEEATRWPVPTLPGVEDLRGATSFSDLTAVIAGADAIVVGNTGPAHIAAATGTPVVSVFAPVVPAHRWRPWRVPAVAVEYGISFYRFGDAYYGKDKSSPREVINPNSPGPPAHFTYDRNATLGSSYDSDQYMIITKKGRDFYPEMYPGYEDQWRFRPADYDKLQNDPSVGQLYDNGEVNIYRITGTGEANQ